MRLKHILGGALRRRRPDQQNSPGNPSENLLPNLTCQNAGLDTLESEGSLSDRNENYIATWNDPRKIASESERLALLESFALYKTPAEYRFDCITK